MDTAIIVSVLIGSVVATVLIFGKTLPTVAWTGKSSRDYKASKNNVILVFLTRIKIRDSMQIMRLMLISAFKSNNLNLQITNEAHAYNKSIIGTAQNRFIVRRVQREISLEPENKVS